MDFWEVPIPDLIGTARSPKWQSIRSHFLEHNSSCICCGKDKDLEVHHIKPVSTHPELELMVENLATLCERCHLVVAHLNDWKKINPFVVSDCALLLTRHNH